MTNSLPDFVLNTPIAGRAQICGYDISGNLIEETFCNANATLKEIMDEIADYVISANVNKVTVQFL